jgi:hypothetical protein
MGGHEFFQKAPIIFEASERWGRLRGHRSCVPLPCAAVDVDELVLRVRVAIRIIDAMFY